MKISIELPKSELVVYPEKRILHHRIKEPINHQEFETLLTKGLELYSKYQCKKWLSDDRKNTLFDDKLIKWGLVWESQIMKTGWKAWAIIPPEDKECNDKMEARLDRLHAMGVKVRAFNNTEDAMAWLEEQ